MRQENLSVWKRWGIWLVVGVGVILVDFLPVFRPLRWVTDVGLKPVRVWAINFGDSGQGFLGALGNLRSSYRRVADLERRVAELTVTAAQVESLALENEALRELAQASPRKPGAVVPAQVTGKGDWWLVDVGGDSGINGGEAVVTSEGALLGVVTEVGLFVSRVQLVTHAGTILGVETQAGTAGELKGTGEKAELGGVLQEDKLVVGDRLTTTGEEGGVPAGLVVGTVETVEVIPSAVYKKAQVKPLFDRATRFVFIIVTEEV